MRVAVTTAADTFARVAAELSAARFEPVALPCIEIVPLAADRIAAVRRKAPSFDLMVLTSTRTVAVTWPDGGMPPVPVAAVGAATAAAVTQAGGEVVYVGDAGGDALAEALEDRVRGSRVLMPGAVRSSPFTAASLRRAGAHVVSEPVYDTTSIGPGDAPVDAALFASPSAVVGWRMTRDFAGIVTAAIGRTTALAIAEAGVAPDVVPAVPGYPAAVRALAETMRERNPR